MSSSLPISSNQRSPIIGLTTYRKKMGGRSPLEMVGVAVAYVEAIAAAGGIPILIPHDIAEPDLEQLFDQIDGLLLPGGGDVDPSYYNGSQWHGELRDVDRRRDELELFMARKAVVQRKPLLAICRGHQVLNVALGGSLWQDLQSQVPEMIEHDFKSHGLPRHHTPHTVEVETGTRLARCLGEGSIAVNSLHHQGISELALDLEVAARSDDGLIEAVEVRDHPFAIGVQWHPENLVHHDPAMLSLFRSFIEAAGS
jgi:gamma-glutamyl-gamma-aminobutyrate hydrolase PuuD